MFEGTHDGIVYFALCLLPLPNAERGFMTIVLALLQLKQYKMEEGEEAKACSRLPHALSAPAGGALSLQCTGGVGLSQEGRRNHLHVLQQHSIGRKQLAG